MDEALVTKYPDLELKHFWWSTRRWLVSRIFRECFPTGEASVLDVGCGSGVTAAMLARKGADVVGIDNTAGPTVSSTPGFTFIKGDYLEKSRDLGQFDLVMALDSMEHFQDESSVTAGMFSNTRHGGNALVTAPAFQWLWSSHDEQNVHYRRYTRGRLAEALESAGFEVNRIGYIFPSLVVPKAGLALIERLRGSPGPSGANVDGWINKAAHSYFRAETRLGASFRDFFPFGTSVIALATRPIHDPELV